MAMVNEMLCKIACHNICCVIQSMYELGGEATFWAQGSRPPSGGRLGGLLTFGPDPLLDRFD